MNIESPATASAPTVASLDNVSTLICYVDCKTGEVQLAEPLSGAGFSVTVDLTTGEVSF